MDDPALRLSLAVGVRQLAKAQTRERVREAARELFSTRGFDDTTSQQIADQARVAVGTLFQHASDKEDLLLLVLHDPMAAAMKEALATPVQTELVTEVTLLLGALFEPYLALDVAGAAALRAHWFGRGPNARAVQWLHETFRDQLAARLERAQQSGSLAEGADAHVLAGNLMGLCQAALLEWMWIGDDLELAVSRLRASIALQLIPLQTTPGTGREGEPQDEVAAGDGDDADGLD
ncbi:hypothetical protein TBR22_A35100 [Luteitalea sp. TBR-22]|nr:hypothetical protein TBR22_A35100 [Luteitalea sp. TBR-22]